MRKFEKKSISLLSNYVLTTKEIQKIKGGNSSALDAQDNVIMEDVVNG